MKSNSTVDGVFCVVSMPFRLIKHLFLQGPARSSGWYTKLERDVMDISVIQIRLMTFGRVARLFFVS